MLKTAIRIWKMFYRLLRLKHDQRLEIISRIQFYDQLQYRDKIKEYKEIKYEYKCFKELAKMYGVGTAYELKDFIDDLLQQLTPKNRGTNHGNDRNETRPPHYQVHQGS